MHTSAYINEVFYHKNGSYNGNKAFLWKFTEGCFLIKQAKPQTIIYSNYE